MFCSNCGKKIAKTAKFCPQCGTKNIANTDTSANEAAMPSPAPLPELPYQPYVAHTTTPLKFFILSLITFGIYIGYWGWRNWEIVKRAKDLSVSPTWRGIFIAFTAGSLFSHVQNLAHEKGYTEKFPASANGALLFIILFIVNAIGRYDELEFLPYLVITAVALGLITLLVTPVIKAMNFYLEQATEVQPKLAFGANVPLIISYVLIVILIAVSSFYTESLRMDVSGEYEQIFVESCMESGGDKSYCGCMYQQLRAQYSITEITRIGLSDDEIEGIDQMAEICLSPTT